MEYRYLPVELIYEILLQTDRNTLLSLYFNNNSNILNGIFKDNLFWRDKIEIDYEYLYYEINFLNDEDNRFIKSYINIDYFLPPRLYMSGELDMFIYDNILDNISQKGKSSSIISFDEIYFISH